MVRHLAAAVVVVFSASCATAQILPGEQTEPSGGVFDPGFFDVGDTSGGASTYEEGASRGFADIVRSSGLNRLQSSVAMKNVEEARRAYIDNRLKATQNYYDIKRMNDDYRASKRSQPLSFEGYVRLARIQAPERLSVSQLDPFTGLIEWPVILREQKYDADREVIEQLYQERANDIASNKREIQIACDNLLASLQEHLDDYAQNDYIAAKRFVESLRYEAVLARN
jgi:hypothetical protein